jgi:hypothetical protein
MGGLALCASPQLAVLAPFMTLTRWPLSSFRGGPFWSSAPDEFPLGAGGMVMGIRQRHGAMTFRCGIQGCGAEHRERRAGDMEESREALAEAQELGWKLTKNRGLWMVVVQAASGPRNRPPQLTAYHIRQVLTAKSAKTESRMTIASGTQCWSDCNVAS